ncbi:MAG: flagellar protein FlgN [Thermodesulfobacteriota bacterium]
MTGRCSDRTVVDEIREESELYGRLLRLVRKERESIARMDLNALGQIQTMKAKQLKAIKRLAQEGSSLRQGWRGWAGTNSQDVKESLETLLSIMREISHVQSRNGLMLQEALAKVKGEIHNLAVNRKGLKGYGGTGQVAARFVETKR